MSVTRRLARPMLSTIFISSGIDGLRNPTPKAEVAEPQASTLASKLGLPSDPEMLVKINAGVQVGAGALLAVGKLRRLASVALLGTLIPTTWAAHRFWEIDDPVAKAQQQSHFFKNLGLAGGLILSAVDAEGAPSLGRRARRKAARAGTAVATGAKLAGGGGPKKSRTSKKATKKAAEVAASTGVAAARAAEVGGEATKKATKAAAKTAAAKKAGEVLIDSGTWSAGAERAGGVIGAGARRAGDVWSSASEHLPIG